MNQNFDRSNDRNIILISPPMVTTDWTPRDIGPSSPGVPMGLLSIGSILMENGYHVKILDGFLGKIDLSAELDQALKQMSRGKVLFVGISARTTQLPSAVKAATIIRKDFPDMPLVWGGTHPTLFPEETCTDPLVDVVVIGEGEYACLELAQALSGLKPFSTIKGIMFKDADRKVVFTGPRTPIDLNDLPFPRYELFDIDDYLHRPMISGDGPRRGKTTKLLHLHTGMGCPFRCTFCINTTIYRDGKYYQKSLYRGKSATRILDEIQMLIDRYGVEHISFVDECFLVDKKRLFKLLDGIEERGLKFTWSTVGKAHYIKDTYLSKDVVKRMRNLGCVLLGFGAESGSQRILDYLKKDITTQQVEHAAKITNDNKIISEFSFMIGLPQESIGDMFKTVDFIKKLKKIGEYVMTQNVQLYRPYPGGELYNESVRLGFDAPRDIREWTTEKLLEIGGFVKPEYLPWLRNDNKKAMVIRYVTTLLFWDSGRKWESKVTFWWNWVRRAAYAILNGTFKIRRKLGFWALPVECQAVDIIRSVKKFIMSKSDTRKSPL
ncbi:MAG: hypothetical protein A2W17_07915 [Planctomycetes bacterium RBG_16_41_13]|nr:MAG: hypothetical protein A2W17_07915 [Planctomycetes bacterium RBG_16_41_13]